MVKYSDYFYAENLGGRDSNVQVLTFSPPIEDRSRCVNITFGDDDFVEADERFSVIFEPVNPFDRFPNGNQIDFTIVDDESEWV